VDVPMISGRNNSSVHSSAALCTNSKRVSIKHSDKVITENKMNVSESQNTSFSVVSKHSIVEKGVLIHIVEDPNITRTRHSQDGPTAVLINVPTEANTINYDVSFEG
jgi:thioredoxin reductase